MAQFCRTVTTWVTEEVLEPVDSWAAELQQKCEPVWWKPWTWICWLFWVIVRIVIWIVTEILVPITQIVCITITSVIFLVSAPFAAAVDAVFGTSTYDWFKDVFFASKDQIKFVSKEGPKADGTYTYTFICRCKSGDESISLTATNDQSAADFARGICAQTCS